MITASQRAAAVFALLIGAALLVLAGVIVAENFPRGLIVLVGVALAMAAAWYGLRRRGSARLIGIAIALAGLAASVVALLASIDSPLAAIAVVTGLAAMVAAARAATIMRSSLPDAPAPAHPVLFYNPKSGGGKAERFALPAEAEARGIRPIELTPGSDLGQLVRAAVAEGADGLSMAGGDGSQAVVASVAAELDLPYACIPSGTRNHFALDLGVDRDDVVGALDAFVDGGERRVDLAEVNGRVFVNNVSLGLYAEAVQDTGYRDAKLRTVLDTIPDSIGPGQEGLDLRWTGPGGHQHSSGVVILVSNNKYRLGRAVGSGTRPHIDEGLLGVSVVSAPTGRGGPGDLQRPLRAWSAAEFEVDSDEGVHAGIDGEAATLAPPLRFRIRPGALRVRIARAHPGISPSAGLPEGVWASFRGLIRIAAGRPPATAQPEPR